MEGANKILPAMINGVLVGFTIGVGFILAKKLLDRSAKVEVVPVAPIQETKISANGLPDYNKISSDFSFADGFGADFLPQSHSSWGNSTDLAPQKVFDYTTGQFR